MSNPTTNETSNLTTNQISNVRTNQASDTPANQSEKFLPKWIKGLSLRVRQSLKAKLSNTRKAMHLCVICGTKILNTPISIRKHMRELHAEVTQGYHTCSMCLKVCNTLRQLKLHRRQHEKKNSSSGGICHICGKVSYQYIYGSFSERHFVTKMNKNSLF